MTALIIGICIGSIYGMMALGIAVVHRGTRMVNFAHGEMGAVGVYAYIQWHVLDHLSGPAGLLVGFVITGLLGVGFGYIVLAMSRSARGALAPVIASFGVYLAIRAVTVGVWGPREPYRLPELFGAGGVRVGDETVPFSYLGSLATVLAVGAALWAAARFTTVGIQLRATVANRDAAELAGIRTRRLQLLSWFVGTGLAFVAAVLYFQTAYVAAGSIDVVLISTFAIAALAGFEHFGAIAVAAAVYGIVNAFLDRYFTFSGRDVVALAVLVVMLFVVPRGLMIARSERYA
ncbi:branched-chain amino acid ABC transporter permease [Pseudonocardia ailaonensis]|uniref:Branched-chain amino acid ABC transporter permease n=1 Tax=Pseudonocardia ailaonensis TaxID=367279 RepID=A0ABN2N552_9PSEU